MIRNNMLLRDLPQEALLGWRSDEAVVFCPRCKSTNVKGSLYRVHDILALLTGFKPHRCKSCFNRFTVWRFLGEKIRLSQTSTALVFHPMPAIMAQAVRKAGLDAMGPASFPLDSPSNSDVTTSLLGLFQATTQFGPGFTRNVVKKRIVEADFSASLAQAAVAVGTRSAAGPVTPDPKPPTGLENRRKGDRPQMQTTYQRQQRTPAEKPVLQPATSDSLQPTRL